MLSSGLSKHLRVMPRLSFFGVSVFLVEGSRDFWHWFSGPFPYSISPSSSPYLHKPGFSENDKNSKNTFQGDSFANKSDSSSTYTFWGGLAPINIDRSSNCWRYMIQVSLSGAASDAVVIHVIFYARSSIWSTWSSIWSLISDQPAPRRLKLHIRCRTTQVEDSNCDFDVSVLILAFVKTLYICEIATCLLVGLDAWPCSCITWLHLLREAKTLRSSPAGRRRAGRPFFRRKGIIVLSEKQF